jgi:cytochrome c5
LNSMKTIGRRLFRPAAVILLLASQGCQSDSAGVDGAKLLEERCSVCHKTEIPKNARKSRAEWDKTVSRMMARGAKLSPEEKKILVRYLARVYKP